VTLRKSWICKEEALPVATQCALAGVNRTSCYGQVSKAAPNTDEIQLRRMIDEEYSAHPFYGTRRMTQFLLAKGYRVNRKRVQR
jgi:putative transposase